MRTTLLFPPAICLPNQLYFALPSLAGALRRAGHEPTVVDLNVQAADLLLDEGHMDNLLVEFEHRCATIAGGDPGETRRLRGLLAAATPMLREGAAHKRTLRDIRSLRDRPAFRDAFWQVVDILAVAYQLDPVLSPYDDRFVATMQEHQRRDPWSTVAHLYDDGLLDPVVASRPELLGICIAFPEQSVEAVRTARRLRQRLPGTPIVVGGPLVTRMPEQWLADDWLLDHVDYVVLGDGEFAIVELADALAGRRALEDVRNLTWRDAAGRRRTSLRQGVLEVMDDLPVPDFACVDLDVYLQPAPILPLMTSRGCYWGKCAMCSIGYQENYRAASADKLARDLAAVAAAGVRHVQLQDSSVPPKSARQFAEIVSGNGIDVAWAGWMKFASCFTDADYCQALARGGCRSLQMGFESADQRLLDLMIKGYRHDEVLSMLQNLRAAGVSTELLWFVGFPTQTRADVLATATFLHRHRDLFGLSSFVGDFGLHPDCDVYRNPRRYGVQVVQLQNGRCSYEVDSGLTMQEAAQLKDMLAGNNNRTLTCNGAHLLHLTHGGLDLGELARPMHVPPEVFEFCRSATAPVAG